MKIILLQDVDHVGEEGEIVDVANGYGRNYLIPQGLARMATQGTIKEYQETQRQQARKRAQKEEDAQKVKEDIEDILIAITAKVGEGDRIYGSVTAQQIAVELSNRGFDVDRRSIELDEDIRHTGTYVVKVTVFKGVVADLQIQVIPESGPIEG